MVLWRKLHRGRKVGCLIAGANLAFSVLTFLVVIIWGISDYHNLPFWPRDRVEAAALVLSIVSIIGGLLVATFGMIALRELRKKP
jgi:hypothetical protein